MHLFNRSGGGETGALWPWGYNSFNKKRHPLTASLLLTSLTISSPADSLRWTPPNISSISLSLSAPPVGRISRLLGLSGFRRYVLLRLFDLGYSLRLRLPILIFVGFLLCYVKSINPPRIEINLEIVDDENPEEDQQQVQRRNQQQ